MKSYIEWAIRSHREEIINEAIFLATEAKKTRATEAKKTRKKTSPAKLHKQKDLAADAMNKWSPTPYDPHPISTDPLLNKGEILDPENTFAKLPWWNGEEIAELPWWDDKDIEWTDDSKEFKNRITPAEKNFIQYGGITRWPPDEDEIATLRKLRRRYLGDEPKLAKAPYSEPGRQKLFVEPCDKCDKGKLPNGLDCPHCKGTGEREWQPGSKPSWSLGGAPPHPFAGKVVPCDKCDGKGRLPDGSACPACRPPEESGPQSASTGIGKLSKFQLPPKKQEPQCRACGGSGRSDEVDKNGNRKLCRRCRGTGEGEPYPSTLIPSQRPMPPAAWTDPENMSHSYDPHDPQRSLRMNISPLPKANLSQQSRVLKQEKGQPPKVKPTPIIQDVDGKKKIVGWERPQAAKGIEQDQMPQQAVMPEIVQAAIGIMEGLYAKIGGKSIKIPEGKGQAFVEFLQNPKLSGIKANVLKADDEGHEMRMPIRYTGEFAGSKLSDYTMYPTKTFGPDSEEVAQAERMVSERDSSPIYVIRERPDSPMLICDGHRQWFAKVCLDIMLELRNQDEDYNPPLIKVILIEAPFEEVVKAAEAWQNHYALQLRNSGQGEKQEAKAYIVPKGTKVEWTRWNIRARQASERAKAKAKAKKSNKILSPDEEYQGERMGFFIVGSTHIGKGPKAVALPPELATQQGLEFDPRSYVLPPCTLCQGSGANPEDHTDLCTKCHGTGASDFSYFDTIARDADGTAWQWQIKVPAKEVSMKMADGTTQPVVSTFYQKL